MAAMTTVILIRHADRAPTGADPHLTLAGRARAKTLIHVLGSSGLKAIFRTHFNRSKETAQPIAAAMTLTPIEKEDPVELRTHILAKLAGKTCLVIGHSDTVPALIALLGAGNVPAITDPEFDNLYVLKRTSGGVASVTRLKYGMSPR